MEMMWADTKPVYSWGGDFVEQRDTAELILADSGCSAGENEDDDRIFLSLRDQPFSGFVSQETLDA